MHYDVVIAGGGIVGLATALQLLRQRPALRLAVLEKESGVAQHQTGHNSGVIHSGIYYKPGSLKAAHCLRGRELLVRFCEEQGIRHELCGKIIVATEADELPRLEALLANGAANGLDGLRRLSACEIAEYEPHCTGMAGIFVPQTGIVDFREVAQAYARLIAEAGGRVLCGERVVGVTRDGGGWRVLSERSEYTARLVINCAGLYADKVAAMGGAAPEVRILPFRGEYYTLRPERRALVRGLIYPVPDPAFPFLGVHFTRRIGGEVEAGPNAVFAMKREGYGRLSFDARECAESLAWPGFRNIARRYWRTGAGEVYRSFFKAAFVRTLQSLVPEITDDDLAPGGAGVRAQACSRDGRLLDDFVIVENVGRIDALNVPSPAATSSLAIGETIAALATRQLA